jgi:hypothetical protein
MVYRTILYLKCTEVVFIGDVIDNHFQSIHETSADGMGGADELEYAIKRIAMAQRFSFSYCYHRKPR